RQWNTTMLHNHVMRTALGAADNFASTHGHFVARRRGEAHQRRLIGGYLNSTPKRQQFGGDAKIRKDPNHRLTDRQIGSQHPGPDVRIIATDHHAVGDLMVVQYGPTAGRPPHNIDPEGCTLPGIDLALSWLGIAQ